MSYDPCQATGAQCKRGYCKTRFQQTFLDNDSVSVDPDESPADHGQVRDGSGIQKGIFKKRHQKIIIPKVIEISVNPIYWGTVQRLNIRYASHPEIRIGFAKQMPSAISGFLNINLNLMLAPGKIVWCYFQNYKNVSECFRHWSVRRPRRFEWRLFFVFTKRDALSFSYRFVGWKRVKCSPNSRTTRVL